MKTKNSIAMRFTLSVFAVAAIALLTHCNPDDAKIPSKQDEVKAILTAAPWNVNTVSVDISDKTAMYKDLKITFSGNSFTTTGGGAIWPASGTWSFTSTDATAFTRDDGMVVSIVEATPTLLRLSLPWNKTTLNPGRTESIKGNHFFSFRR